MRKSYLKENLIKIPLNMATPWDNAPTGCYRSFGRCLMVLQALKSIGDLVGNAYRVLGTFCEKPK